MNTNFKTPENFGRVKSKVQHSSPSFSIPPSPYMTKIGYGTGVSVFLMDRYSPLRGCYKSPWAVKKVNSRGGSLAEFRQRIRVEADILKDLCHPNIIGFRSYKKGIDGAPYLMMECGEKSLLSLIEERQEIEIGPFPAEQILKMTKDVASALNYLHVEKKLLHGDLKSANILIIGEFKVAKLCDFGVTMKLNKDGYACSEEEFVGTECWSPPEVFSCTKISHRSDMFSLGLVMWEMLSLNVPHIDKLIAEDFDEEIASPEELEAYRERKVQCELEYTKSLGTRPPVPDFVNMSKDEYPVVIEFYYACTATEEYKRPSAYKLLCAFEEYEKVSAMEKENALKLKTQKEMLTEDEMEIIQ